MVEKWYSSILQTGRKQVLQGITIVAAIYNKVLVHI